MPAFSLGIEIMRFSVIILGRKTFVRLFVCCIIIAYLFFHK